MSPRHWAYIKISRDATTVLFCSIPSFRGDIKAVRWIPIVAEAEHLAEKA